MVVRKRRVVLRRKPEASQVGCPFHLEQIPLYKIFVKRLGEIPCKWFSLAKLLSVSNHFNANVNIIWNK